MACLDVGPNVCYLLEAPPTTTGPNMSVAGIRCRGAHNCSCEIMLSTNKEIKGNSACQREPTDY